MWLMRRVMVLILVLAVLCAGAVVVARANRTPSPLQALGFGMCDGEPCWRGIKPGMKWEALKTVGSARLGNPYEWSFRLNEQPPVAWISIGRSVDPNIIGTMSVLPDTVGPLPISVSDWVIQYGPPCSVLITGSQWRMMYPIMASSGGFSSSATGGVYLSPETSLTNFHFWDIDQGLCRAIVPGVPESPFREWRGFASYETYQRSRIN
jgi:hypothetical protein